MGRRRYNPERAEFRGVSYRFSWTRSCRPSGYRNSREKCLISRVFERDLDDDMREQVESLDDDEEGDES